MKSKSENKKEKLQNIYDELLSKIETLVKEADKELEAVNK